jgi:glycosyltransferase involved in cell wall biosynthesis
MNEADRSAPRRVSVILAARDAAATIDRQLAALAAQHYQAPWEVVVIDNGSKDATKAVVSRWAKRLADLRLVDASERTGASYARNAGVAASTGDFLVFCDADDEVDAGWLAAMARTAVGCDLVAGYVDMRSLNEPILRTWSTWEFPSDQLPRFLLFLPFGLGASLGAWRSVLEDIGGWDEAYRTCTDVSLCWRAQLRSFKLCFARDAVVRYRLRDSMTGVARQAFGVGRGEAQLFREFRRQGVRRAGTREVARFWAGMVLRFPKAVASRARRGAWMRKVARRLGRLWGSARYRVWFP